jgi:hypothetical protein
MGKSVLERIALNRESTVANLITPAGYQLRICRARQVNPPAHLQGYIFQLSPEDINDAMTGSDEQKQAFAIVMHVMPAEDDITPIDTYNNDIAAALRTALMADYQCGGLALNTIIVPTLYFPPIAGDVAGITFLFDVHYRTALDKPFIAITPGG